MSASQLLPEGAGAETLVASSDDELAAFAAEYIGRAIMDAVASRGVARVALSGGTTPGAAYRRVAEFDLPWGQIEWFWVDERAVEPSHERSNFRAAASDLRLESEPASFGRVHRMPAEEGVLADAGTRYEALLRQRFGEAAAIAFDVMTLGIGDDGHTASLFPGRPEVLVSDRLVAAVPAQPEKGLEARLSLTAPVICESRLLLVLAKGSKKQKVIAEARAPGSETDVPSRLIQRAKGRVIWIVDSAAVP